MDSARFTPQKSLHNVVRARRHSSFPRRRRNKSCVAAQQNAASCQPSGIAAASVSTERHRFGGTVYAPPNMMSTIGRL